MSALHEVVKLKRLALETTAQLRGFPAPLFRMGHCLRAGSPPAFDAYEANERMIMRQIGVKDEMLRH